MIDPYHLEAYGKTTVNYNRDVEIFPVLNAIFEQIFGGPMFMFVVIIILFWVMLIRPQRKAQKEQQARIASLQRGDKVVTNAGLHGFIEKVNERTVSLKIAEGVIVELEKNAIVHVEK